MNKPREAGLPQATKTAVKFSLAGCIESLLYAIEDGCTRLECRFVDDSLCLSQALMAELFQTSKQNISPHLKNVLAEGELQALAHAQNEYKHFVAQRRAALESEGEAYAVRMLSAGSTVDGPLAELGKVDKRLMKKKGGRDAA